MKIGEKRSIIAIKNQDKYKWVVLSPLTVNETGEIEGGVIYYCTQSRADAGKKASKRRKENERALVVEGAISSVSVGEVFV
jgi:hypothetical protein